MRTVFRIISVILLLFNGLGATYGGWNLMVDPSGQGMQIPLEWMADSVFGDYFIPGLVLFAVNGLFNLFVIVAIVMRLRWHGWLTMAAGFMLCIWLTVQIKVIGVFYPPLHISYYVIGIVLTVFGFLLSRPEKPNRNGGHSLSRYHRLTTWMRPSTNVRHSDHIKKEALREIAFILGASFLSQEFVFLIRTHRNGALPRPEPIY